MPKWSVVSIVVRVDLLFHVGDRRSMRSLSGGVDVAASGFDTFS